MGVGFAAVDVQPAVSKWWVLASHLLCGPAESVDSLRAKDSVCISWLCNCLRTWVSIAG